MHISLDAALQRQPLLSTVGDKLLPTFPGAAAAYSLRALNGDANNVVNVRRDADDAELDFTAEGVSFELEDWVNGKLEDTLPADVDTAAAAYSLRKVRDAYTGNALQIRRASDDVEVNVAFDANNEVSASSAISNVTESPDAGDTTATTLGGFLTEGVTIYQPDYSTSTGLAFPSNVNLYANQDGIGGKDDALKLEVVSTGTGTVHRAYKSSVDSSGGGTDSVTVSYEIFVPSGSASQEKLGVALEYSATNKPAADYPSALDTWETVTHTFDGGINTRFYIHVASVGGSGINNAIFTGTTGDHVYIRNLKVEQVKNGAYVVTWYDQSVNGYDATQDTAGSQPKIAEAGVLLGEIKPDGNDDFLINENAIWDTISNTNLSCMTVTEKTYVTNRVLWAIGDSGGEDGDWLIGGGGTAGQVQFRGGRINSGAVSVGTSGAVLLTALDVTGGDGYVDGVASGAPTSVSPNRTADRLVLFTRRGSNSLGTCTDQAIKEIIFFNSDQSDNRFKIESNINNYYGIYNDANEFASSETEFRFLGERSGGVSTVNGFDSFTLDVQTASAFVGADLKSDVPSGDSVYLSFYASLDEGANTASPKLTLKDVSSSLDGTLKSNIYDVTAGFNSVVLTSTGSDANGLVFSEGDDNAIFTISDFKLSSSPLHNGFVETWYDQSGNGNHAVQSAVEGYQPKIVSAGSLITKNGKPSMEFTKANQNFLNISGKTSQTSSVESVFAVYQNLNDAIATPLGSNSSSYLVFANGPNYAQFGAGGFTADTQSLRTTGLSTSEFRLHSIFRDNGNTRLALFADGVLKAESTIYTAAATNTFSIIGGRGALGNTDNMQGHWSELILFNSDQSANRTAIESNIADEYGITLS